MRSPTHWDDIASRARDRATYRMEYAVDDADDEAEGIQMGGVQEARVSGGGEQHGVLPEARRAQPSRPQPARRSKTLELNLTDAEYAVVKAYAEGDEMPPSTWARLKIMDALALLKAGE